MLGINFQTFTHILHNIFGIIGIINSKIITESQPFYVPAQNPHTGGVKGGHPYALRTEADDIIHSFPHFSRRLIGKGYGQDIPGVYTFLFYQVSDPVGQHTGLAASRAGKDQHRAIRMEHSFLLPVIQGIINAHFPSPISVLP